MLDVWNFFQKIRNVNNVIISFNCQLCEAEYGSLTSTSTLRRHLMKVHASTYVYEPNQLSRNSSRNFSYTGTEQKYITTKLTQWVAADLQPFTIVEQEQFRELVHTLDPYYNLPCRQTLKEEVNLLFSQRKSNIKSEINNLTSKVALTTDIWSSTYNNTAFLGITMHCITNDWKIKKCLLNFISIEGSHSAALILTKLTDVLQEFNISDRIISLTTDNGSNMLVCERELASELETGFFNFTFTHNRCAAHIINLAVKAGMKHLNSSIVKLRKFVNKIKNSQLLIDDLKSICKIKNVKFLMPI
jgi:hypothetical protein